MNKLFILFKQDNNWFKRLIMSFEQVILSCLNKIITRLNDLLSVSQLTETSLNVPKRARTDRNGSKMTYKTTETDFSGYRNGLYSVPKRSRMCFQFTQKKNTMGTRKARPDNGQKQVYVCDGGR